MNVYTHTYNYELDSKKICNKYILAFLRTALVLYLRRDDERANETMNNDDED